jgi:FMN phosphatase YigB (HAD superfamily)
MNVPKVVVFDLGKVLLEFDYRISARRIAERGTASAEAVQKFLDHSPLLFRYETGLMSKEEFFAEVRAFSGFRDGIEEFGRIFGDIFTPMPEMIGMHAALRRKGVPTYIFSNTNELAVAHIRREYPFFAGFDGYVFSYEQGSMKPHARIYEVIEETTKRRGAEILYLDDRPENVAAGAARGWVTILQETPEASWRAVRKLGLLD